MGFWKQLWKNKKSVGQATAGLARDRLNMLMVQKKARRTVPDFLPQLCQDIEQVLSKYIDVRQDAVSVQFEHGFDFDSLEFNIELPESTENDSAAAL